jgi:hypothetical protein
MWIFVVLTKDLMFHCCQSYFVDNNGYIALMFVGKYVFHTVPGGGVKEGEDLKTVLRREVRENNFIIKQ